MRSGRIYGSEIHLYIVCLTIWRLTVQHDDMRLWSLHPCYLDAKGLVALWREALLARKVLTGETKGYGKHPQLIRFKDSGDAAGGIAAYLRHVADEADRRGYRFDRTLIPEKTFKGKLAVTSGQIRYEFDHLLGKLKERSPELYELHKTVKTIRPHPLIKEIPGDIEPWEKRRV
jgi:hypothetical protein